MTKLPPISRRKFLAQTVSLAAAGSMAGCATIPPLEKEQQQTMITRLIPGTNERLPVCALGSPDVFYTTPEGETDELPKSLVQTMFDYGGRVIDTPAFFRPDPPVLGPMIQEMNLQDELFLVGKITVDKRKLIWIWTYKIRYWLRMLFWSGSP